MRAYTDNRKTGQAMAKTWFKFPNGKVWRVDPDTGAISGRIQIPLLVETDDEDDSIDLISEAVTGSPLGLTEFSYEYIGNDCVTFEGHADLTPGYEPDIPVALGTGLALGAGTRELRAALQDQYGLSDIEVTHAFMNLDNEYGEECILSARESGRELRCPAFPAECSYVRVVIDGLEVAYWIEDEWRDDPAVVMGAIFGAARAGKGYPQ
jgi:hypothetical protein